MDALMDCHSIPYTRLPKVTPLLVDYLYHFDRVAPFFNGAPFDLAGYRSVAAKLQGAHSHRREVCEVLERQNKSFGCETPTFSSIRRLADPATFAVVTGQQVGLLSGPAFTLYKALTAVRLAQWLSEQGLPSVPVFWLATEDHDLEEVAGTAVLDEEYNLVRLNDPGERPAPRSSVGVVKLSGEISGVLDRLEAALPAGGPRSRLLEDLRSCYQPGATWGRAFGHFLAKLFSRYGVVLLDPMDETLHRLSVPVFEQAITQAAKVRERLMERSQALVRAGYQAQVHVAEDSTLVFVNQEGNRLPVRLRNGGYLLDESEKVAPGSLLAMARNRPLDFSANVLLRPVVQDMLLPTLAYVAGPSELAYLAQAQLLYSEFGRPMPVIFPRAAFTLVDARSRRVMEKYAVVLEDVWKGEEHLGRQIAAQGLVGEDAGNWSRRFAEMDQQLATALEGLRGDVQAIDPTLQDSLKQAQEKINYQLERIKGKISRAALEQSELLARHQQGLLRFLTPAKDLQEREVGGVYFLGRAGYELLDRLLIQIQTRSSDHQAVFY